LDNTGAALERYHYDPYGKVTRYAGDWGEHTTDYKNPYLYTGRRLDAETGLYYYFARYYHAQLGRFINRDPIGYEAGDENLYRYLKNRPIVAVDPAGLQGAPGIGLHGDPMMGGATPEDMAILVWDTLFAPRGSDGEVQEPARVPDSYIKYIRLAYDDCTALEVALLMRRLRAAAQIAERALFDVGIVYDYHGIDRPYLPYHREITDRIRPILNMYFAPQNEQLTQKDIHQIWMTLYEIRNAFKSSIGVEGETSPPFWLPNAEAWTYPASTDIHILMPEYKKENPRGQVSILLHEISHEYASTKDYGYWSGGPGMLPFAGGAYPGQRPKYLDDGERVTLNKSQLLRNADTYSLFLMKAYTQPALFGVKANTLPYVDLSP